MRHHTRDRREIELLTRIQGARKAIAFYQADPERRDTEVVYRLRDELSAARLEIEQLRAARRNDPPDGLGS